MSNVDLSELPVVLEVKDLRRLGFSRGEAYELMYRLGKKVRRRFLVSREALLRWFEFEQK